MLCCCMCCYFTWKLVRFLFLCAVRVFGIFARFIIKCLKKIMDRILEALRPIICCDQRKAREKEQEPAEIPIPFTLPSQRPRRPKSTNNRKSTATKNFEANAHEKDVSDEAMAIVLSKPVQGVSNSQQQQKLMMGQQQANSSTTSSYQTQQRTSRGNPPTTKPLLGGLPSTSNRHYPASGYLPKKSNNFRLSSGLQATNNFEIIRSNPHQRHIPLNTKYVAVPKPTHLSTHFINNNENDYLTGKRNDSIIDMDEPALASALAINSQQKTTYAKVLSSPSTTAILQMTSQSKMTVVHSTPIAPPFKGVCEDVASIRPQRTDADDFARNYSYSFTGASNPVTQQVFNENPNSLLQDYSNYWSLDQKNRKTHLYLQGIAEAPPKPKRVFEEPYKDDKVRHTFDVTRTLHPRDLRYLLDIANNSDKNNVQERRNTVDSGEVATTKDSQIQPENVNKVENDELKTMELYGTNRDKNSKNIQQKHDEDPSIKIHAKRESPAIKIDKHYQRSNHRQAHGNPKKEEYPIGQQRITLRTIDENSPFVKGKTPEELRFESEYRKANNNPLQISNDDIRTQGRQNIEAEKKILSVETPIHSDIVINIGEQAVFLDKQSQIANNANDAGKEDNELELTFKEASANQANITGNKDNIVEKEEECKIIGGEKADEDPIINCDKQYRVEDVIYAEPLPDSEDLANLIDQPEEELATEDFEHNDADKEQHYDAKSNTISNLLKARCSPVNIETPLSCEDKLVTSANHKEAVEAVKEVVSGNEESPSSSLINVSPHKVLISNSQVEHLTTAAPRSFPESSQGFTNSDIMEYINRELITQTNAVVKMTNQENFGSGKSIIFIEQQETDNYSLRQEKSSEVATDEITGEFRAVPGVKEEPSQEIQVDGVSSEGIKSTHEREIDEDSLVGELRATCTVVDEEGAETRIEQRSSSHSDVQAKTSSSSGEEVSATVELKVEDESLVGERGSAEPKIQHKLSIQGGVQDEKCSAQNLQLIPGGNVVETYSSMVEEKSKVVIDGYKEGTDAGLLQHSSISDAPELASATVKPEVDRCSLVGERGSREPKIKQQLSNQGGVQNGKWSVQNLQMLGGKVVEEYSMVMEERKIDVDGNEEGADAGMQQQSLNQSGVKWDAVLQPKIKESEDTRIHVGKVRGNDVHAEEEEIAQYQLSNQDGVNCQVVSAESTQHTRKEALENPLLGSQLRRNGRYADNEGSAEATKQEQYVSQRYIHAEDKANKKGVVDEVNGSDTLHPDKEDAVARLLEQRSYQNDVQDEVLSTGYLQPTNAKQGELRRNYRHVAKEEENMSTTQKNKQGQAISTGNLQALKEREGEGSSLVGDDMHLNNEVAEAKLQPKSSSEYDNMQAQTISEENLQAAAAGEKEEKTNLMAEGARRNDIHVDKKEEEEEEEESTSQNNKQDEPIEEQELSLMDEVTGKEIPQETFDKLIRSLNQIKLKAMPFEEEIKNFTELENSNKHYYIEESLRRLVDRLDDLFDDVGDVKALREARREVYKFIFPMFEALDAKVEENRNRQNEQNQNNR